jgi:hypothetical protein
MPGNSVCALSLGAVASACGKISTRSICAPASYNSSGTSNGTDAPGWSAKSGSKAAPQALTG